MGNNDVTQMKIFPGHVGSEGVAIGQAYIIERAHLQVRERAIQPEEVEAEIARFADARKKSLDQLHEALVKVSRRDHRIIIESHMMLTADDVLFEDVQDLIEIDHYNAEWAVRQVMDDVIKPLNEQDEQYLKERTADLEHVAQRLIRNLIGRNPERLDAMREPGIIVAHDLSPADMAHLRRDLVQGIILDVGGSTGHTAILARGMRIPTLVGLEMATLEIRAGDVLVLDAIDGRIIVNPIEEILDEFRIKQKQYEQQKIELLKYKDLPSVTRDHHEIKISANIELPDEIPIMLEHGIHSVGLFRTEFVYMTSSHIPTEEEQFVLYRDVLQQVGMGNPVTIRTLDLGADKILPQYNVAKEANPALGTRAIRFSLSRPEIFKDQLRALYRASVYGTLRIMFPMISGLTEVRRAKELIEEVKSQLDQEGIEYSKDIEIGIMMEVPSAAFIADVLAREVDFFSIGTNDLIQYMLAVDRVNEQVNYLYTPLHPAVLRLIDEVVRKGHEAGIKVGMCGEMAGYVHYSMLLAGLGLDELSMPVTASLRIKWFLRNITLEESKAFAREILSLGSSQEVIQHLQSQMSCRFPELFPKEYWEHH